jgi:hypothetical protein
MTYQQVIWAINDAAILAAESAFDAFGNDPAAEIPSPEVAWEFLNEQVYEEIERPAGLPQVLTRQFKQDYSRHIRRMVAKREGRTV